MRLIVLASLLTLTVACARAAEEPAPTSTGERPTQVSLEQKGAQEKPTADKPVADKAARDPALRQAKDIQQLRAAGYKPVTKEGATLWCRDEQIVGSRFTKSHCGSLESIRSETLNGQAMAEQVRLKALAMPSLQ